MARVVNVDEFGWAEVAAGELLVQGRLEVYPWSDGNDFFTLRVTSRKMEIQARGWVGIIPLNDSLTLNVKPRVEVAGNLSHLMEVSKASPRYLTEAIRRYDQSEQIYPPLVRLYADALTTAVERILDQGFFKEYQRRQAMTSMPHGRVLMGPTIQRSIGRGRRHEAAISWHQRTIDNPVNQCIRFAVYRLAAYSRRFADVLSAADRRVIARQLNRCDQLLSGIELDLDQQFLSHALVTGAASLPALRQYYRPALDLSLAIISGSGVSMESTGGGIELPSLLISMDAVFESYLRNVLRGGFVDRDLPAEVLDGNRPPGERELLDSGPAKISARPDVVIATGPRSAAAIPIVLDAKYKPARERPKRGDLEQVITYGVSYRASHIVVLQPHDPRGLSPGLHRIGSLIGMRIWMYVYDLGADNIAAEERRLVDAIAALLPAEAHTAA